MLVLVVMYEVMVMLMMRMMVVVMLMVMGRGGMLRQSLWIPLPVVQGVGRRRRWDVPVTAIHIMLVVQWLLGYGVYVASGQWVSGVIKVLMGRLRRAHLIWVVGLPCGQAFKLVLGSRTKRGIGAGIWGVPCRARRMSALP